MAQHFGQREIDRLAAEGRLELLRDRKAAALDPINLEAALALGQPIPLLWREVVYLVGDISVPNALKLQRINLRYTKHGEGGGVPSEQDIDAFEALYLETVDLFWSLLDPKPAVNPFSDLTPREVGELIPFFFVCLTMQNSSRRAAGVRH